MSQVYYFGDPNAGRGTYFFHTTDLNGWVVANCETGWCRVLDRLAVINVAERSEADSFLETHSRGVRVVLGRRDRDFLVKFEDAVFLLRDYHDDITAVAVYEQTGVVSAYPHEVLKQLAGLIRTLPKG